MLAESPRPAVATRDYANETIISGKVSRLFRSSPTFSAGIIAADNGPMWDRDVRFSGKAEVQLGEILNLTGAWKQDPKWGWGFVISNITYPMPDATPDGLAHYLSHNPNFKGIGPVKAKLIADAFSSDFDNAIRYCQPEIAKIGKLTLAQVAAIAEEWTSKADQNAIGQWLSIYKLTHCQVKKIIGQYGSRARQILTENPYLLTQDIDGFGFATVDEIALAMGVSKQHPGRICAYLVYAVNQEAEAGGHTWILRGDLIRQAVSKLAFDTLDAEKLLREQLKRLCEPGEFREDAPLVEIAGGDGKVRISSRRLWERESALGEWLREAMRWD